MTTSPDAPTRVAQLTAEPQGFLPGGLDARGAAESAGRVGEAFGGVAEGTRQAAEVAGNLLERLPWEAHAVTALGLVVGVVLWLFGRKLIKAAVGGTFALAGAMIGLIVLPQLLGAALWSVDSAYIGLAAGGLLGLGLGLTILKWAVVASSGASFALIGLVASMVYVHMAGPAAGGPGGEPGDGPGGEGPTPAEVSPGGADAQGAAPVDPAEEELRREASAFVDGARERAGTVLDELGRVLRGKDEREPAGTAGEDTDAEGGGEDGAGRSFGDEAEEQLRRAGERVLEVARDGRAMLSEAWRGLTDVQRRVVVV